MKKILLLGGSKYLLPVIESIHRLGYYAITCDYLPNNIAHQYSDEYHNVSIVEKDKVLELARKLKIDGIMSFACDPGVETAAYVAEKLGLPSAGSYNSVSILQNKAKFRSFLKKNGFNVPEAKGYSSVDEAVGDLSRFRFPVIVKPTDSAGSKGVTRVDRPEDIKSAGMHALEFSKTKTFIVEEFIEKKGCSSDSDCFSVDGRLLFCSFSDQRFDDEAANPYAPSAYSWPSTMPESIQKELRSELQRLISLLKLKTSLYNVETRFGRDGKAYIMEVSPRGGGNRLSEMLHLSSGVNLIEEAVKAAVGERISSVLKDPVYDGAWAELILHSKEDGKFDELAVDSEFEHKHIVQKDLWVKKGDLIHKFTGANFAIGTLVLRFDSQKELMRYMKDVSSIYSVHLL